VGTEYQNEAYPRISLTGYAIITKIIKEPHSRSPDKTGITWDCLKSGFGFGLKKLHCSSIVTGIVPNSNSLDAVGKLSRELLLTIGDTVSHWLLSLCWA
jgi:hypothetical protein